MALSQEDAGGFDDELDDLFDDSAPEPVEALKLGPKPRAGVSAAQTGKAGNSSSNAELWDDQSMLLRLPKAVSYSERPFAAESYSGEADREELMSRGKTSVEADAVPPEAVIRWAFDGPASPGPSTSSSSSASASADSPKQQPATKSNTRLVRWSDGTMTIQIGEFSYDLRPLPVDSAGHFMAKRSGKAQPIDKDTGDEHLGVAPERGSYLESVGRFTHRGALRPVHAPASSRLVLESRSRHSRNIELVRQVELDGDPERATAAAAKRMDEINRARELERMRAAGLLDERQGRKGRGGMRGDSYARGDDGVQYEDEDLGAIRKGVRTERFAADSDDEDDDDDEDDSPSNRQHRRRTKKTSGLFEEEEEEAENEDEDEDEDEDEGEDDDEEDQELVKSAARPSAKPVAKPPRKASKGRRRKLQHDSSSGSDEDVDDDDPDDVQAELVAALAEQEDDSDEGAGSEDDQGLEEAASSKRGKMD